MRFTDWEKGNSRGQNERAGTQDIAETSIPFSCKEYKKVNTYTGKVLPYFGSGCDLDTSMTSSRTDVNLLKPTGYVMHQQFNIQ